MFLKEDVKWDALPADVPASMRQLLRRCLTKDPRKRLRDIGEARLMLEDPAVFETGAALPPAVNAGEPLGRRWLSIVSAVAVTLAASGWTGAMLWPEPPPQPVIRTTVTDPDTLVSASFGPAIAISPDGTHVVYRTRVGERYLTKLRSLDSLESQVLYENLNGVGSATFSPDGAWVVFSDNGEIKRVPLTGGPALTVSKTGGRLDGLALTDDGFIIFGSRQSSGLLRVPVAGGTPEPLTNLDTAAGELSHAWPVMMPGGRAVLFTVRHRRAESTYDASAPPDAVAVLDLETRTYKVVITEGHMARYTATGHLVYSVGETLIAVPFDADRLEVTGTAVPVASGIATALADSSQFALSDTGTLLYLTGDAAASRRSVPVWVDRTGVAQPIDGIEPDDFGHPRLSPDGKRFSTMANGDAWVFETLNGRRTRLTRNTQTTGMPVWSPDGSRVAYTSSRGGRSDIWVQTADGGGEPERVTSAEGAEIWFPSSWSPDGNTLAVTRFGLVADVLLLPLVGTDRAPRLLIPSQTTLQTVPQHSPDGRYVAFTSGGGSQWTVEIHPATGAGARVPVSVDGGVEPIWGRNGELFYRHPVSQAMMHVRVTTDGELSVGTPALLFDASAYVGFEVGAPRAWYDVTADGQRFLMLRPVDDTASSPPQLILVQNWFDELRRLVPVK